MAARIFVSFAAEDIRYRDLFCGQKELKETGINFIDLSVKQPWDEKWKTNCRSKIKGSDGLVALLTRNTWNAAGARWEMRCADEEGVPMLGVHIFKDDKGAIPPELTGHKVIDWTWAGIKAFLDRL